MILAAVGCAPESKPISVAESSGESAGSTHDLTSSRETPNALRGSAILTDVTDSAGIDFQHFNGTTGEYLLPEITGSGVALFDFDNDGDLDIYFVQGTELKTGEERPAALRDRLYRSEFAESGKLHFVDVTAESGIVADGYGMGVACADFNNDGLVDLFVTNLGSNQLWQNEGKGTFRDVTSATNCDDPSWTTSAAFLDYDCDGWLDLFLANYVVFSPDMKRRCFAKSSARDYCGPDSYEPAVDRLLHNRGDGTFEDVSNSAGITVAISAGLGVVCLDLNGDKWTDIYVANDGDPNQMWINEGGTGQFRDESLLAGTALNRKGQAEASMGVDAGDIDGDGDPDLIMTHIDGESNTLFVNMGKGQFDDRTIEMGLHQPSLSRTGFGTGLFDFDNDGWLDLFVSNGAVQILDSLSRQGDPYPLSQPNQLFRNRGGDGFDEVLAYAGDAVELSEVSRGTAFGDIDNDGDTDVVILNSSGRARLLLNEVGNQRQWIGLRALDKTGKRDALHTRIEVVLPSGKSIWRRIHADGSYCSSSDPRVLVGLDDVADPVTVRLHWLDGQVENWPDLTTNRYWKLQQGASLEPGGIP